MEQGVKEGAVEHIRKAILLDSRPRNQKRREVEAFGHKIFLQKLDFRSKQQLNAASTDGSGNFDMDRWMAALVIMSAQTESGEAIFTPADYDEIMESDGTEMQKITSELLDMHGMTKAAVEKAAKDLRETTNDAPSSSSEQGIAASRAS